MKWEVVSQTETTQLLDGKAVNGMTVRFRLESGTVSSVFVPWDQYTADRVRSIIAARADALGSVEGLTSS